MKIKNKIKMMAFALDFVMPNWFNGIDLDKLEMQDGQKCILGQLYRRYTDAPKQYREQSAFGGHLICDDPRIEKYNKFWAKAVRKRLKNHR